MNEPEYIDDEQIYKKKSSDVKKQKRKGLIQKFFDLWHFSEDEDYFNYL